MLGARHVEVQLTNQVRHRLGSTRSRSTSLHATTQPNSVVVASWVTDETGMIADVPGQVRVRGRRSGPACRSARRTSTDISISRVSTREVFVGTFYVAAGFLLLGLAAYYCFRRLPLAALDRAQQLLDVKQAELISQKQQLEMQNLRFDAALNNMSQGLCMFDGEQQAGGLQRALRADVRDCRPSWSQPGTPFADILKHRLATGLHVEQSPDDYVRDLQEIIAASAAR